METKTKPALKNTHSRSPLSNVFARIQKILVDHGACEFTYEIGSDGRYTALKFAFQVNSRLIHFRMPANVEKVRKALLDRAKTVREENEACKQDYQVAWANVRDWLDVQMALIDIHMAELPQVFLPYALNANGKAFYEVIQEHEFQLSLPEGVTEGEYRDG